MLDIIDTHFADALVERSAKTGVFFRQGPNPSGNRTGPDHGGCKPPGIDAFLRALIAGVMDCGRACVSHLCRKIISSFSDDPAGVALGWKAKVACFAKNRISQADQNLSECLPKPYRS